MVTLEVMLGGLAEEFCNWTRSDTYGFLSKGNLFMIEKLLVERLTICR